MIPLLLTKLDKTTQEFISSLVTKGEQKSKLVSVSLAKALVDELALPTELVESSDIYFSLNYKEKILKVIIAINELITINKDEILDYAKRIYNYRYSQSYTTEIVPYINKETAVEDFFGISKFFSQDFLQIIKDHNTAITVYVNKFNTIISKLD